MLFNTLDLAVVHMLLTSLKFESTLRTLTWTQGLQHDCTLCHPSLESLLLSQTFRRLQFHERRFHDLHLAWNVCVILMFCLVMGFTCFPRCLLGGNTFFGFGFRFRCRLSLLLHSGSFAFLRLRIRCRLSLLLPSGSFAFLRFVLLSFFLFVADLWVKCLFSTWKLNTT